MTSKYKPLKAYWVFDKFQQFLEPLMKPHLFHLPECTSYNPDNNFLTMINVFEWL